MGVYMTNQNIEMQLRNQEGLLLAACERKVRAHEEMDEAEKSIREARMSIATLRFALDAIKRANPVPRPAAPDVPNAPNAQDSESAPAAESI